MKRIQFLLLLTFLSAPIFLFSFTARNVEPTFQTAIYPTASAERVRLVVVKPEGQRVFVRVIDEKGEPLLTEVLGKKGTSTHMSLNIADLTPGTYRIEVSDARHTRVKELTITAPAVERQVAVRVL